MEGFARFRSKVQINFFETSYGSLKESMYLIEFCYKEKFILQKEFDELTRLGNEVGAMLWSTFKNIK